MAYYTALINEWALLTPGTTAAKLAQINAMTVTGTVPTLFNTTGAAIFSCLNYTEFLTLTTAQQTQLMQVLAIPGTLIGGSASTLGAWFVAIFAGKLAGPTITALTALAQGAVQPWWQANGYTSPIDAADLVSAGGLT
jgi:hypothetical protein